jgi:hypothetical protein
LEGGDRRDLFAVEREHEESERARDRGMAVVEVGAEGGLAVGAGRYDAQRRAAEARPVVKEEGDGLLPSYSNGNGGMVTQASSASRATTAFVSPRSTASANRPTISRSSGESGTGAREESIGRWASAARTRWSAL